jgi:hypothetical protein
MNKLPKFVRLGNSALRLIKRDKIYYRDAGHWEVGYKVVDNQLLSCTPTDDAPWLDNQLLIEITEQEWRWDNAGYI